MPASLLERIQDQDRGALARALSILENQSPQMDSLADTLRSKATGTFVIGVTGPPGAGKSTLISAMVSTWRQRGQRVAVLAVDPSSPLTRGALLGDRIRMDAHSGDPGVFIRSVASRGQLGGLSRSLDDLLCAVDVGGWDTVLLETVGTGQSEVEVAAVADVSIVLSAPGLGDEIQALKAGLLEIADIMVVNKADHPLAAVTRRQLTTMMRLRDPSRPRVTFLETVATEGTGVDELVNEVEEYRPRTVDQRTERIDARQRTATERMLIARLHDRIDSLDAEVRATAVEELLAGRIDVETAEDSLVALLSDVVTRPCHSDPRLI